MYAILGSDVTLCFVEFEEHTGTMTSLICMLFYVVTSYSAYLHVIEFVACIRDHFIIMYVLASEGCLLPRKVSLYCSLGKGVLTSAVSLLLKPKSNISEPWLAVHLAKLWS